MRSTVVQKCQAEMVAIFAEKVMAEQAEIVRKRAGMWGRTGSLGIIWGMVCNMRDGGGRRIIRRVAPHPAGR
ncbi:hypothetical protein, partial [Pantoea agglomerans]|uniref:hypothetical protein n=1 Tax=Enterobacter agglomerans TaxID=549 RepID=UPI003C7E5CAD